MPLNTRVGRCVTKLRKKYGYGKAIGICQHSTKQNYLTGKTIRKKKTSRRKNRSRKKRGGRKKKKGGASKPDHIAIDIKDIEHRDARPPVEPQRVEPQRVDADGIHVGSNVKVIDGDSPNLDDTGLVVVINNDELASIEVYLDHADEEESFRPDQLELIREGGRKKQKKKRKKPKLLPFVRFVGRIQAWKPLKSTKEIKAVRLCHRWYFFSSTTTLSS